jgi:ABC-2 type transport system ATP-binding protein
MRHLQRVNVKARVVGTVPDVAGLPGLHEVVVDGPTLACSVDPDGLPALLGALTAAGVQTLTSTPPTLEELFLDVYRAEPEEARR